MSQFSELVVELLNQYGALEHDLKLFASCVREDHELPILLPEYQGEPGREAALASLTQTFHLDGQVIPRAGLLCSSARTIEATEKLNRTKLEFQQAVKAVRNQTRDGKTRMDRLIDRVLQKEGRRTEELERALHNMQLSRLDLLRCYAQIRILPPRLRSISWTWATQHAAIMPIEMNEAVEMAKKLGSDAARSHALNKLAGLPSGQVLAYKKPLPSQLRANLVYQEKDGIKRKAVTISGIVLSQDPELPRYVWRDNPDEEPRTRLTRMDMSIDPEPYIGSLRLHLYLKGPNATPR